MKNDKAFIDLRFMVTYFHQITINNFKITTKKALKKKIFDYIFTQSGILKINKRDIDVFAVQELGVIKVRQFINDYVDNMWYKQ